MDEPLILFEPASWSCTCPNGDPCAECRAKDRAALGALSEHDVVLLHELHRENNALSMMLLGTSMMLGADVIRPPTPRHAPRLLDGLCENCNGKRSSEANYCPRCGHRRNP
jgi:hypothetical protein